MSLLSHTGTFSVTTAAAGSTQSITGCGFKPSFVIFFFNGQTTTSGDTVTTSIDSKRGIGFATASGGRLISAMCKDNSATPVVGVGERNDACIGMINNAGAGWEGYLSLQSMDSNGFTLSVSVQLATSYTIMYLAVGGTDITNVVVGTTDIAASAGIHSTIGVGFKPDCLLLIYGDGIIGAENTIFNTAALSFAAVSAAGTYDVNNPTSSASWVAPNEVFGSFAVTSAAASQGVGSNAICFNSTGQIQTTLISSFDPDGFSYINALTTSALFKMCYLAIKGGKYNATTVTFSVGAGQQTVMLTPELNPTAGLVFDVSSFVFGTAGTGYEMGVFSNMGGDIMLGTSEDPTTNPTQVQCAIGFSDCIFDMDSSGFKLKSRISSLDSRGLNFTNSFSTSVVGETRVVWVLGNPVYSTTPALSADDQWLGGDEY